MTPPRMAPTPSPPIPDGPSREQTANLKLIAEFFDGWQRGLAAEELARFLSENCVIRLGIGAPSVADIGLGLGRDSAIALFKAMIEDGRERRWIIDKAEFFGPLVLNVRSMSPPSSSLLLRRLLTDRVVGVFVVERGKIREWTDYNISLESTLI